MIVLLATGYLLAIYVGLLMLAQRRNKAAQARSRDVV